MSPKLLLFGFDELSEIMALQAAAAPFGAELVPVKRTDYNETLGVLSGFSAPARKAAPYTGAALGGKMMVFCGLDAQLDDLLSSMAKSGAGVGCLKAVLTQHNRNWSALKLFGELFQERQAFNGR